MIFSNCYSRCVKVVHLWEKKPFENGQTELKELMFCVESGICGQLGQLSIVLNSAPLELELYHCRKK